jgi:hypothetical protein
MINPCYFSLFLAPHTRRSPVIALVMFELPFIALQMSLFLSAFLIEGDFWDYLSVYLLVSVHFCVSLPLSQGNRPLLFNGMLYHYFSFHSSPFIFCVVTVITKESKWLLFQKLLVIWKIGDAESWSIVVTCGGIMAAEWMIPHAPYAPDASVWGTFLRKWVKTLYVCVFVFVSVCVCALTRPWTSGLILRTSTRSDNEVEVFVMLILSKSLFTQGLKWTSLYVP